MVTKSREYSDIRSNMLGGLDSLGAHDVAFDRIVLANPGLIKETHRDKLRKDAAEKGARLDDIYDRGFFASKLRRDKEWRSSTARVIRGSDHSQLVTVETLRRARGQTFRSSDVKMWSAASVSLMRT